MPRCMPCLQVHCRVSVDDTSVCFFSSFRLFVSFVSFVSFVTRMNGLALGRMQCTFFGGTACTSPDEVPLWLPTAWPMQGLCALQNTSRNMRQDALQKTAKDGVCKTTKPQAHAFAPVLLPLFFRFVFALLARFLLDCVLEDARKPWRMQTLESPAFFGA